MSASRGYDDALRVTREQIHQRIDVVKQAKFRDRGRTVDDRGSTRSNLISEARTASSTSPAGATRIAASAGSVPQPTPITATVSPTDCADVIEGQFARPRAL